MGSGDVRLRAGSPEITRDTKKHQDRIPFLKEEKGPSKEMVAKSGFMEGNIPPVKDEDDKTTEQSSSQHL